MLQLVFNPTAGKGRARKALDLVTAFLEARGVAYELHLTEGPGHATELAAGTPRGSTVVALGGDGTVHEVVKGLLRGDDADRSIGAGADAIQVSNHGGRQIDGVPASIAALPDVAQAVNGRVPIILDSGIRRGIDVIRALAMGANAVAVGRPVMYGLGLGGAQGVQSVLEHLRGELQSAMLLSGAAKLSDLDPSYINLVGPSAESNRS